MMRNLLERTMGRVGAVGRRGSAIGFGLVISAALAACASSDGNTATNPSPSTATGGDGSGGGVVVATGGRGLDDETGGRSQGGRDLAGGEGGAETGGAETGGAETGGAETGGAETGGGVTDPYPDFGGDCLVAQECSSAFCLEMPDGLSQCSKPCVSSCDDDQWRCAVVVDVAGDDDPTALCVPRFTALCRPCEVDDDCRIDGVTDRSECVPYFDPENESLRVGSFCGTYCEADEECPSGYLCEASAFTDRKQCVKEEGICECQPHWADRGYVTSCEYGDGGDSCRAERTCDEDGLTECMAAPPTAEICNGLDDDCNDVVDDGSASLCNDELPCTDNVCDGIAGCTFPPKDDKCLIDGACYSDGDLKPGEQCRECDADNAQEDWSNSPPTQSCSDGESCTASDYCSAGTCVGIGTVPASDGNESNDSLGAARDIGHDIDDRGTSMKSVSGTFHSHSDLDWFKFTIKDEDNYCATPVDSCGGYEVCDWWGTKQPRPTAEVESGSGIEICLTWSCNDGTADITCNSGSKEGQATCCSTTKVKLSPDCTGGNDDAGVGRVEVRRKTDSCSSYTVKMGNEDSGCGW